MMETTMMNATMCATVCRVWNSGMLVCDHGSNQLVVVHTDHACWFCPGNHVCIHFNGVMAQSMPPQITATCICRCC